MRFKGLDLNLLIALDVLLDERSVSAAAARMNLTQPALSAALSRLRRYFDDDLLLPVGRRMIPTPLAEELRPLTKQLMRDASLFINMSSSFDPATSKRRFGIGTSDYIITVLLAPLLARLDKIAPSVQLDVFPTGPEIHERLDRGEIDLVIAPEPFLSPSAPSELLFEEHHVVLGWSGNPAMREPLTTDRFFELGHIAVRIGMKRELSFAERHLEAHASRRRIEVTTTAFSSTPRLLVGTSRIAVLQERLAATFLPALPLIMQPLPIAIPLLKELVQFHPTRNADAGVRWLIDVLREVIAIDT
jgi:DNA-binding transcriptional LysR family regulator